MLVLPTIFKEIKSPLRVNEYFITEEAYFSKPQPEVDAGLSMTPYFSSIEGL